VTDELEGVESAREERREHDRSRFIVDVFFDGKDATGVASTRDLGSGGLYLNTQAELPQGALLLLRLPLGRKHRVVNAQVAYCNPGRGVGLQFQGLSAEDKALLQSELGAD
jgi:Tfp pilus assembly protein PilZ